MTYLVDANVLSEATRPDPDPAVLAWMKSHEDEFVVNSIVLAELGAGVLSLPAGRKRARLEEWLRSVVRTVECLPWDLATALRWAKLVADLRRRGRAAPLLDSMIAASALAHELTVVTRDVEHFESCGISIVNPFGRGA